MTELACVLGTLCGLTFYALARTLGALARMERDRDEWRASSGNWQARAESLELQRDMIASTAHDRLRYIDRLESTLGLRPADEREKWTVN